MHRFTGALLGVLLIFPWPASAQPVFSGGGSSSGGSGVEGDGTGITDAASFRSALDAQQQTDSLDDLGSLSAPVGANVCIYSDGAGSFAYFSCTAAGRALLDDASASAQRTTLGVELGVDAQVYSEALDDLDAVGAATGADEYLYSSGAGTWALGTITSTGRAILDDASTGAQRTTLGLGTAAVETWGAILDDLVTTGANAADSEFLVGTGAGALTWESGATVRTSLGLGTVATLNVGTGASNVVQLDGSSKLPAVDGSALTNLPAASAELSLTATPDWLFDPHVSWSETGGSNAVALTLGSPGALGPFAARQGGRTVFGTSGQGPHITAGTAMGRPASWTTIGAVRVTSLAADNYLWGSIDAGGTSTRSWGWVWVESTGEVTYQFGDDTNRSKGTTDDSVVTAGTWVVIAVRYSAGDTDCDVWIDGASAAVTTSFTAASASTGTAYDFSFGRTGATATLELVGDLGPVAVYDEALSDGNVVSVSNEIGSALGL